jgi:sulfoxide reductase catalytic subunit YedY
VEWRKWLTEGYGKKLKKLHAWNGWVVLLLAVTGIILYIPALRGPIASFRVGLKELHIILGVLSIVLLLLYLPLMGKHLKQLIGKVNQRVNLSFVLFLLIGWSISGVILWQERNLPKAWSQTALFWHDLLTYVGVPYIIFHSISRSRWMRKEQAREMAEQRERTRIDRENAEKEEHKRENNEDAAKEKQHAAIETDSISASTSKANEPHNDDTQRPNILESLKKPLLSRRTFIQWVTGLLLVFAIGPSFFRWIKSVFDDGGTAIDKVAKEDGNEMSPDPTPLPDSNPPIGGGAQGNFRVYTVTPIPAFTSLDWEFVIGGLVTKPQQWSWEQFLQLPRKVQVSDFHCVTGWSVYNVTWEGIPLSELLKLSGIDTKAKYVKFYSGDGVYTDALSLEQAAMDDVMVAVMMDGKPIPQSLGGPVKLVVPQMYAYKAVKWLQAIELIEEEHLGYWQVRGYDTDAWVKGKS